MSSLRATAARVLLAVGRRDSTLADELERARPEFDDARDRALLLEIVAGTLRWRNELDAVLVQVTGRAIDAIDPPSLAVLRLGAYQLRHLTRVPPHAIVHESVEAIRDLGTPKASGFVNAVLRSLVRKGQQIALPLRPKFDATDDDRVHYLSTTLSHPEWLVRRWLARYGFEGAERWCEFNNSPPDVAVRSAGRVSFEALVDLLRADDVGFTPAPFVADAVRLSHGGLGQMSDAVRGEVLVQEEASQLVARATDVRSGERVLDVCASPGGKTLVMANDLAAASASVPTAAIVACDRRRRRVALLKQVTRRSSHPIQIVTLDASLPLPFPAIFDCVLVDAPCSGLGTLRRDPDLKWARTEADLARFAATQQSMLRQAADVVQPGGRIVYATCSSEPDENIDVVDAFLAGDDRFELRPIDSSAIDFTLLDARGCLATEPVRHGLEAFFAAVLVRRRTT